MEVLLWLPSRFFKAYGQLSLSNCLLRGVCVCMCVFLHVCADYIGALIGLSRPLSQAKFFFLSHAFSCFHQLNITVSDFSFFA